MQQINEAIEKELGRLALQVCIKDAIIQDQRTEISALKAALAAVGKKDDENDVREPDGKKE